MSAPILLSNYRMKKNSAPKEHEAPVDLKTFREFRAEMMSRFAVVDERFVQLNSKIDEAIAEMKAMFHRSMLLLEEQNLRNKQAYDGYAIMYEAVYNLKNQIKPDCLKE